MKSVAVVVLLGAALAGCADDEPAAVDAAVDAIPIFDARAPSAYTCVELHAELEARVEAAPAACEVVADCRNVGSGLGTGGYDTCDGELYFAPHCSGAGVTAGPWNEDVATLALVDEWTIRCVPQGAASGVPPIFDCRYGDLSCVDGTCRVAQSSCFDPH